MEYENIIFDLSFLGTALLDVCSQKYLQPLLNHKIRFPRSVCPDTPGYEKIAGCLDEADDLCRRRCEGFELGVKACILRLFSFLFELGEAKLLPVAASRDTEKLKTLLNFLEQNYPRPLGVSDAARVCGYSSSHFMRVVQADGRHQFQPAFKRVPPGKGPGPDPEYGPQHSGDRPGLRLRQSFQF